MSGKPQGPESEGGGAVEPAVEDSNISVTSNVGVALGDLVNTLVAAHHSVAFDPVHLDADM